MLGDLVLDIETAGDITPEMLEVKAAKISAPSNWKDPEKIVRYHEEARAKITTDAALDPLTGRVVAVGLGVAGPDGWVYAVHVDESGDEAALLRYALGKITESGVGRIVTFCGKRFDVPYLLARCMRHGLAMEGSRLPAGRYNPRHLDLYEVLGEHGSLAEWAALIGEAKTGSGADVGRLWSERLFEDLREYCRHDVFLTATILDAVERVASIDRR